jgi:TonB family protein
MATGTTQKWLIGCGIGCAALILLIVGLVTSGIFFVRSKLQPLQEASDSRKAIIAAYGAPESYVPPASGTIAPERMEAFLSVRDALKNAQDQLDAGLASLDFDRLKQNRQSFGSVLRVLNDLSNVIVPIGAFMNRRNQVLLDKRMGLGEYAYIYTIAYHSWLGHAPNEGPPVLAKLRLQDRSQSFGNDSNISPESVRRQYRRVILRLLGNQLNSIKDEEHGKWRDTLRAEIDRIDRDPERVAWQDNLPPPIEESLKPYRNQLASTYHPSANFLEFLTLEEFNQVQWGGPPGVQTGSGHRNDTGPVEAPEAKPGSEGTAGGSAGKEAGESAITYEVGSGVIAPVPIHQPHPIYTDEARKAHVEGLVSIQATVRKDGSVASLRIIRSLGYGLDEAAMNIIATQWKFKPGTQNGTPLDVRAKIDVRFRLN